MNTVDPGLGTLRNLNVPEDYEQALRDAGLSAVSARRICCRTLAGENYGLSMRLIGGRLKPRRIGRARRRGGPRGLDDGRPCPSWSSPELHTDGPQHGAGVHRPGRWR